MNYFGVFQGVPLRFTFEQAISQSAVFESRDHVVLKHYGSIWWCFGGPEGLLMERVTGIRWYAALRSGFPILSWLPRYNLTWLKMDLIAGLTVGLTAVPQALAYAEVAGLPVQVRTFTLLLRPRPRKVFLTRWSCFVCFPVRLVFCVYGWFHLLCVWHI